MHKLAPVFFILMVSAAGLHAGDFGPQTGVWKGFAQYNISISGKNTRIVAPTTPAEGNKWVMRALWPEVSPQVDAELLARGYYIVYMDTQSLQYGSPRAVSLWDDLYQEMTLTHGFADKPVLVGGSRGALQVYNWGYQNLDKIEGVFCRVPVCDIKSWPGNKLDGTRWATMKSNYGFANNAEAFAWDKNPVDTVGAFASTDIPIFNLGGSLDESAPPNENAQILYNNYTAAGGDNMQLVIMSGASHKGTWDAYFGTPNVDGNMAGIVDYITASRPESPPPIGQGLLLSDNFNTDSTGLNDDLTVRQSGQASDSGYLFEAHAVGNTAVISNNRLAITSSPTSEGRNAVWLNTDGRDLADKEYSISTTVSFQTGGHSSAWASVVLDSARTKGNFSVQDLLMSIRANGTWTLYENGTVLADNTTHGILPPSLQYDIELLIDETGETKTVDMIVDGVTKLEDISWNVPYKDRYIGLMFYGYSHSQAESVSFDNLEINVIPEPGSIVLLGIGALILVSARRLKNARLSNWPTSG